MARSTTHQLTPWFAVPAVAVGLLASFASDGAAQGLACDTDHIGSLPMPEVRVSGSKAAFRAAPEPDAKVVITLPRDIRVPLLDRSDEWYVVGYRDRDRYRRLFVSVEEAEGPPAANLEPHQVQVQEWATSHTRTCERIAREAFATKSLAVATVAAGLTSIVWHVYVDDDDHYGTAFAVWTGIAAASLVGTVYKALVLGRVKGELADLGGPPSFARGGGSPAIGPLRGDLLVDAARRRLAVVATWRP